MPQTTVTVDALSALEAFQSQIGTPFIALLFGVPILLLLTSIRSSRMVALRRHLRLHGTMVLAHIAAVAWAIQALNTYGAQISDATAELYHQAEAIEVTTTTGKELLHRSDLFCMPNREKPTTVDVKGYLADGKTEFTGVVTRDGESDGLCTLTLSIND